MKREKYTAKTLFGLENALAEEIKGLGGNIISVLNRAVFFEADLRILYKINICSRLSLRIIKPIKSFRATKIDQFYKASKKINWLDIMTSKNSFAVDSVVNSKYFTHSKYAALKLKDAIADQFRERTGKRPNVDIKNPDFRINLHIDNELCTISLDSSGDSLHKRGYRIKKQDAPLNEVLAAGMIILSGWKGKSDFIDPMCGSGTIGIEAALIGNNIAPNLNRRDFGFMKWNSFNRSIFDSVKLEISNEKTKFLHKIICNDINKQSISSAKMNAKKAGISNSIEFHNVDFIEYNPVLDSGTLIANPPYGERMKQENVNNFYKNIGDTLKKNYKGLDAWILSSNKEAMKNIGLRTSRRIILFNGALECKYYNYKLYEGSKKKKYEKIK